MTQDLLACRATAALARDLAELARYYASNGATPEHIADRLTLIADEIEIQTFAFELDDDDENNHAE